MGLLSVIGSDGLLAILYQRNFDLWFMHCDDLYCSEATIHPVGPVCELDAYLFLGSGPGDFPLVGTSCRSEQLVRMVRCLDSTCEQQQTLNYRLPGIQRLVAIGPQGKNFIVLKDGLKDNQLGRKVAFCSPKYGDEVIQEELPMTLEHGSLLWSTDIKSDVYWTLTAQDSQPAYNLQQWRRSKLLRSVTIHAGDSDVELRHAALMSSGDNPPVLILSPGSSHSSRGHVVLVRCSDPTCTAVTRKILSQSAQPATALEAPGQPPVIATTDRVSRLKLVRCLDHDCEDTRTTAVGQGSLPSLLLQGRKRITLVSLGVQEWDLQVLVCDDLTCKEGSISSLDLRPWLLAPDAGIGSRIEGVVERLVLDPHARAVEEPMTVPRVGAPMPAGASATGIVHKGRLLCNHEVEAGGVQYCFDVVCATSIVVYVQTRDPRFKSPEGIVIGFPLERAMAVPHASPGMIDGSWGVSLPSGWIARPRAEFEAADEFCNDLRSESVEFFDTRYLGP